MSRLLAALAAAALAAATGRAAAQPAQLVNAIDGAKPGLEQLTLVGESGQLYQPGDQGWRREQAGGIAGDVAGAARGDDGTLFLIGGRAPLYEWVDRAWRLRSLGVPTRSRASTLDGMPILAAGRQLYTLEGSAWRRIGSAPTSRIDVIWASSSKRICLADDNGEIRCRDGGGWKAIPDGFTAPERVVRLVGIGAKALFAVGDAGTLVRIDGGAARPVSAPAELQGFRPTAVGTDGATAVYLAGPVPTAEGGARQVLASVGATGDLALVDELPALADGDRYSLIVARPRHGVLVASYAGTVRIRAVDGSWSERSLSTQLPDETPVAERTQRRPARTR